MGHKWIDFEEWKALKEWRIKAESRIPQMIQKNRDMEDNTFRSPTREEAIAMYDKRGQTYTEKDLERTMKVVVVKTMPVYEQKVTEETIDEHLDEIKDERKIHFVCGKPGLIEMEIAISRAAMLYGVNELDEEQEEILKEKRKHLEETVEEGMWCMNGLEWKRYGV